MTANMKLFLEAASKDKELAKKLSAMTDPADMIDVAKELGIELTEADFELPEGEMSNSELAGVAGGGECYCVAGGGGTESDYDEVCACIGGGVGFFKESMKPYTTTDNLTRCACALLGSGNCGDDTASTWH